MTEKIDGKIESILIHSASEFFLRESNGKSLITFLKAELKGKGKEVTIYFTTFPDEKEEEAFSFLKRKRGEFREYLKEKSRLGLIPWIDFEIDKGEKNRQKIQNIKV